MRQTLSYSGMGFTCHLCGRMDQPKYRLARDNTFCIDYKVYCEDCWPTALEQLKEKAIIALEIYNSLPPSSSGRIQ